MKKKRRNTGRKKKESLSLGEVTVVGCLVDLRWLVVSVAMMVIGALVIINTSSVGRAFLWVTRLSSSGGQRPEGTESECHNRES